MPSTATDKAAGRAEGRHQFGTFGGVFTPSILTIFGVIMFLRTGWVVGEAGVGQALVILCLAEAIVLCTAISMAAVATNTPVRGGGAYFLISRALGPHFGGAIGLALFLAQAVSVPFYVIGFSQAVVRAFPAVQPLFVPLAIGTTVLLFALTYLGADTAIRAQYVVMAVLGAAIVAVLGGAIGGFSRQTLAANWSAGFSSRDISFWPVFAVYFPAVTGILAGVNMSGDLKDPARSLVRGTMAAIAVGFAVYLAEIVLCGGSQSRAELIEQPYETLLRNALFGASGVIVAGVMAATLSSAIGSFLGAPRVLQAVARDRVLPGLGFFARGSRSGDEPRRATVLALFLALAVTWFAADPSSYRAFDLIAAIVTMFFLATYGMINLAAFVESFGANPSFRPRFRFFHWSASLAGAIACGSIMVVIDLLAAVLALLVVAGLYALIHRRQFHGGFSDARRGFFFSLIRRCLQALDSMPPDPRNWRPNVLVLSGDPSMRASLIRFGGWLGTGRGLMTAAEIIPGTELHDGMLRRRASLEAIRRVLVDERIAAFPEALLTTSLDEGIRMLLQAHSIGPIKPNTVLLGWPRQAERVQPFMQHLRTIAQQGKSIVCVVEKKRDVPMAAADRIEVWWEASESGSLLLLLAHLLTENWAWKRSDVTVVKAVARDADREGAARELQAILAAGRFDFGIEVRATAGPPAVARNEGALPPRLLMLGFQPPDDAGALAFHRTMDALASCVPTLMLVSSGGDVDMLA